MEKVVKKFASFEEAEKSDILYYSSLEYDKKLEIIFNLIYGGERPNGTIERLVRIYPLSKQE